MKFMDQLKISANNWMHFEDVLYHSSKEFNVKTEENKTQTGCIRTSPLYFLPNR